MENGYLEQSVSLLTRHEHACQREIRESFSGTKVDRGQLIRPRESLPVIFAHPSRDATQNIRSTLYVALLIGHKTEVHLYFEI